MIRAIIEDASVIFLLICLMTFSSKFWLPKSSLEKLIAGLFFGFIAILAMLHPVQFTSGVIIDPRLIVLSAATFFGGAITGLIATFIGMLYRLKIGGDAATLAVFIMVFTFTISWLTSKIKPALQITQWIIYYLLFLSIQLLTTYAIYTNFPPTPEEWKDFLFSQLVLMPLFALLIFVAIEKINKFSLNDQFVKEAKEKVAGISEAMTDLLIILDEDGKYIDIYGSNESLLASPKEDLIGKTLHEVLPKDKADFFLLWVKSVLNENTTKETEYSLNTLSGLVHFEAKASPMKTSYHNKKAVSILTRDITKYKNIHSSST